MDPVTGWINKAENKLEIIELFFDKGLYDSVITTSYMLMFSAVKALLLLKNIDCKTHEGLIYLFKTTYVDTELFPKKLFKAMCKNKELKTDYYIIAQVYCNESEAEEYLNFSKDFLRTTKELIDEFV